MKRLSFRSIITVTLILVIASFSFTAFHIFSHHLEKKIYEESEKNISSTNSGLALLKDQIYYTIDEHDGKIISTLLQRMEDKEQVLNAYLFDENGAQKCDYPSPPCSRDPGGDDSNLY